MSSSPANVLSERFHLDLPDDLRDWFDEDGPVRLAGYEFADVLPIERIMDPQPGDLWGGFMPPDTLPILGNRYGDWICLRLDATGRVKDWICWRHGGGDWTIIGQTFEEALIYESVSAYAHGGQQPRPSSAAAWALRRVALTDSNPPDAAALFAADAEARLRALLAWRPLPAAQRDLALLALDCPFRQLATPLLAEQMSISWDPDFLRMTFDTSLISTAHAAEIRHRLDAQQTDFFTQDWDAAERAALATLAETDQLGWAFDIAGWAEERRGNVPAAVQFYRRGLHCSAFSDESVMFRTHWFSSQHGKFCGARLSAFDETPGDAYSQLLINGAAEVCEQVATHWSALAELAAQRGDLQEALTYYWKAGWDVGFIPLDRLPTLLEAMIRVAESSGAAALAEVIRLHRKFVWQG